MEVDEDAVTAEGVAEKENAATTTPKSHRRRQPKKKKAAPFNALDLPADFDSRELIEYCQEEEERRQQERTQMLVNAGFPLHTPKCCLHGPSFDRWS